MATLPCPFCGKPRWGDCRRAHHCGSRECAIAYKRAWRQKMKQRKLDKQPDKNGA